MPPGRVTLPAFWGMIALRKDVSKMTKRIPLKDRPLPDYTRGEEWMNTLTHACGVGLGIIALVLCLVRAKTPAETLGALVFGITMIGLYAVSSIYHGMPPGMGKKVMQVIDHCAIYFLISGTYTPILLSAFLPVYPKIAWGLLALQWGLCITATVLTAIDLRRYRVFSMICYIGMGWSIIAFLGKCVEVMTVSGFALLLAGGIVYTVGAVLYGLGGKRRWLHSIFHVFVVAGSLLQFLSVLLYAM